MLARAFVCVLLLVMVDAVIGADQPEPLEVSVVQVLERRSLHPGPVLPNRCVVELQFVGTALADTLGIQEIRLAAVRDDLGTDLIEQVTVRAEAVGQSRSTTRALSGSANSDRAEVSLKLPPRQATKIARLTGALVLAAVAPDRSNVVEFDDITSRPGKALEAPPLGKAGVALMHVTPATFAVQGVDFLQGHAVKLPDHELKAMENMLDIRLERLGVPTRLVGLLVVDPEQNLLLSELTDDKGQSVQSVRTAVSPRLVLHTVIGASPSKLGLRAYLRSDKAVRVVPFDVHDIALP